MLLLAVGCVRVLEGFSTPEAALHDPEADLYLLTNIAGHEVDDVGWIARIGPDGEVVDPRWIDAAEPDVTLDTPKGLAFDDDGVLHVADGASIRRFDRHSGAPLGDWLVPDAEGLNDLIWTGDGLLATDLPGGALFALTREGEATRFAVGGAPNGIVQCDGAVTVADWETGALSDWDGATLTLRATLSAARLDGLICDGDGLLVASWDAGAILRWGPEGESVVLTTEEPADISLDATRDRLLVPEFGSGRFLIAPR
jgi:sugar lactone lactonase YvrE